MLVSVFGGLEATAGIEPAYTDLQSAASPLRHVAMSDEPLPIAKLTACDNKLHGARPELKRDAFPVRPLRV